MFLEAGSLLKVIKAGGLYRGTELEFWENRCVFIDNEGFIESIESFSSCPTKYVGGDNIVLSPPPANSHTHLTDWIMIEEGTNLSLEELVAPPNGVKHRMLSAASEKDKVMGYIHALNYVETAGTGLIIDFKEEGKKGCLLSREAYLSSSYNGRLMALGRVHGSESIKDIFDYCDGYGISSPLDYSSEKLKEINSLSKYTKKPVAAHIAETLQTKNEGDLIYLLEHIEKPSFIVHGTYLDNNEIGMISDKKIPVALCPRSNMFHSLALPPVKEFYEAGVSILIGSDNAAWQTPNVWREAETVYLIGRVQGIRSPGFQLWVLRGLFINPYKAVGLEPPIIEEGFRSDFLLLEGIKNGLLRAKNKHSALLKRIDRKDIISRIVTDYKKLGEDG